MRIKSLQSSVLRVNVWSDHVKLIHLAFPFKPHTVSVLGRYVQQRWIPLDWRTRCCESCTRPMDDGDYYIAIMTTRGVVIIAALQTRYWVYRVYRHRHIHIHGVL
jgi:hypothetical protein